MVRANLWELTLQCGETSSHWREGVELSKNSDEPFASLVCEIFSFYDNLFRRFIFPFFFLRFDSEFQRCYMAKMRLKVSLNQ